MKTLIVALYVVCARKGVNNLLNHTPPVAGTSGSMNQVWGLPEQDSIYGRLRRLKYFLQWLAQQSILSTANPNRATTLACSNMHNKQGMVTLQRDHPSVGNGISLMPAPAS